MQDITHKNWCYTFVVLSCTWLEPHPYNVPVSPCEKYDVPHSQMY